MAHLHRTQVLLEPEQHESLQQLAAAEGRSMSELIREAVAHYMAGQKKAREKQEALAALAELSQMRQELVAKYGVYDGDLLNEARQERDADIERVWRGDA